MSSDWLWLFVRASALLMIGGLAIGGLLRWLQPPNPRWHRLAWGLVLLQGVAVFPMTLTLVVPQWMQVVLSDRSDQADRMDVGERSDQTDPTDVGALSPPAQFTANPLADMHAILPEGTLRDAVPRDSERREHLAAVPDDSLEPADTAWSITAWKPDFLSLLPTIWLGGAVMLVVAALGSYLLLNLSLLNARPAGRKWSEELQALLMELGLNRSVGLVVHPTLGPLLCRTPGSCRIVVPAGLWSELTSSERSAVLHHELSHLRRGDLWSSLIARVILILHWFNPMAWRAARRFDEAAEWSCDALMAREQPARVTQLANALLAATTARENSPLLAMAATGGPLFQRIRRLVSWNHSGESTMQKLAWLVVLCPLFGPVLFDLQFTSAAQVTPGDEGTAAAEATVTEAAAVSTKRAVDSRLAEFTDRIVVGDSATLKEFIAMTKTPTGQIVMADRAALRAQEATSEMDSATQWQTFVANSFVQSGDSFAPAPAFQQQRAAFVKAVAESEADIKLIAPVFQEVAAALASNGEDSQLLQRFLKHEGAPTVVYARELRSRLHPGIEDLGEALSEQIVRDGDGKFVIRPARRAVVEERLNRVDRLYPVLQRFEKELAAWGDDLASTDQRTTDLKGLLADPNFAVYLASGQLSEDSEPDDELFEGVFWRLEEATNEAAAGLVLVQDSDQLSEIEREAAEYRMLQERRYAIDEPLKELVARLRTDDALHERLKAFLQTELATIVVAREMNYSPRSPDEAAREWMQYFLTKNDQGLYDITIASPEELRNNVENFFQEYREIRRRGRTLDEFANNVTDKELQTAMKTLSGKLLLVDVVERSIVPPDVDGLQLWFDSHFEETAEGLKLQEWAGNSIEEVLNEAAELEKELSKADF
jgi:beta-lactamase regulating signal transducer with metallopeptidase domain